MLWLLWCDGWYGVRLTLTLRVGVRREGLCRQLDHGATRRTTAALGSVKGGCECVCVCVVGGMRVCVVDNSMYVDVGCE